MQKLFGLTFSELPEDKKVALIEQELNELIKFILDRSEADIEADTIVCPYHAELGAELLAECVYEKAKEKLNAIVMDNLRQRIFINSVTDDGYIVQIVEF